MSARLRLFASIACVLCELYALQQSGQSQPSPEHKIKKLNTKFLPNAIQVHERVISGGLPEGDDAFAELKKLGVRTIISVDAARPDLDRARQHGMRYVHLPHGYDGVPERRRQELAKVVRDLDGPIYLHCHHGKHRSPAASAVACIGAGLIDRDAALTILEIAGTNDAYRGLYQSVMKAERIDQKELDQLQVKLTEAAEIPPIAEAMIEIDKVFDRLKVIEQQGWPPPANQPELKPDHQALLLRELFTELHRTDEVQAKPEKFQLLTREAQIAAQGLEDCLTKSPIDEKHATQLLLAISRNCQTCHKSFRDIPLQDQNSHR